MSLRQGKQIFSRALLLRCPDCGWGRLYRSLFQMHHHCAHCGLIFEREPGYFVTAIYMNVVATEFLLLVALGVWYALFARIDGGTIGLLLGLSVILPLLFFRHCRSLWLGFDHLVDPQQNRVDLAQYD